MGVKQYKKTEIGPIPEDWELDYVENVAQITTGNRNTQDRILDGEYPFFVRSQTVERINSWSFEGEAVLTAGDGVGTGKVFHYINGRFDVHQRVYQVSKFSDRIDGYYFFLHFSTRFYERVMQMTAKSSVDSVRREMISRMLVPLPPTVSEQRAIGNSVREVSDLIARLDELISKKRDLKQAAMQELLTGKKRLPGFGGPWRTKKVIELGDVRTGGTPRTDVSGNWGGQYPWITPTDISSNRDVSSSERRLTELGLRSVGPLPPNAVLVTCIASIGKNAILKTAGACNQQINAVIPNADNDPNFLYYLFESSKQHLLTNAGMTATTIISKATFCRLGFSVPALNEQSAIAKVLSDIDAEIAALEARRDKTRLLKQGMMQELLTGRIRLV